MRIAMDGRNLSSPILRGMDRYVMGLVPELLKLDIRVALLMRDRQPIHPAHRDVLGCDVLPLGDRGGLWWEQVSVPLALSKHRFDLYHAPAERGVPYMARCPVVLTWHSATRQSYGDLVNCRLLVGPVSAYLGEEKPRPMQRLWDQYQLGQLPRADYILTPSEFSREEIVRLLHVPADKVTAVPLAVDPQFKRDTRDVTSVLERFGISPPFLLYVGGYEPHKNVPGTLAAFARARAQFPKLSMVLVGSSCAPPALRSLAGSLGIVDSTRFLAGLYDELVALYDAAELFISMSWRESFGLPYLEAMSRGLRVVASRWGASREVVGDAGVLVDPRDPHAAAEAIIRLLHAPNRAAEAAIAKTNAARFNWPAIARRTAEIYRRAIATSGRTQ